MIFVYLLSVILIWLFLFLLFMQTTVWKKHWALEKKYLVRREKSELIYLVGLGRLRPEDELFEKTYTALEVFEEVCGQFSFRHVIAAIESSDREVFNKEDANRLSKLLESSADDVKKVVRGSFETIGKIVLKNSLTTSFVFFLIRKTFVRIMFYKLPRFILGSLKRMFRKRWDAISKLLYFEDKMNLRFN